ncbi:DUF805 domain-containing protein [Pelagibacteraceae bacterium]|nr:DUF805 domain-containing protein [Pelagibacteraceae bacterium]
MFVLSIKRGFASCFNFNTRATRSELWYFYLFAELLAMSAFTIDNLFGFSVRSFQLVSANQTIELNIGPLFFISFFLTLIPLTALRIRRLHDTNRSGFWYLAFILLYFISFFNERFSIVVFFGYINLIIFWCMKSDVGVNKYGPECKLVA